MLNLNIDGISVQVPEGTSILDAARSVGIHIRSLCNLPKVHANGSCRVCLVEVEGARSLVASCVTPAANNMKVFTNTKRVRDARRTMIELLLSEHNGDCQTCNRNNECELQAAAYENGIMNISYPGEKASCVEDSSSMAIVRQNGKCIKCRRCVAVCSQVQAVGALFPQFRGFKTVIAPSFGKDLSHVVCVQCGQCAAVCPVGAIVEKSHIERTWNAIDNPKKVVVVQTAPAVRAALGECFGMAPGTLVTGKMFTALRKLGFDMIFDTNFTADLTIVEEGTELLMRLKKAFQEKEPQALPQFTSCSPGWIKFMEHYYPELLPNLSTCKSPQQMFGTVVKTYWAEKMGKSPEDIFVVSIMPCTAKKFEASREEFQTAGCQDVDAVLTTRELGRMIREAGIDFPSLEDGEADPILGLGTGAADIFANTGGVMEAALRTAYPIITGRDLPFEGLHVKPLAGLDGIKEASITLTGTLPEWSFLEGVTLNVAVAHTLSKARKIISDIQEGKKSYHFVEVMTCPGGCIGGGGQPRITTDEVRQKRIEAIYREDDGKPIRKSHENPMVKKLYEEFLKTPLGEKSHHLLHTKYRKRECV